MSGHTRSWDGEAVRVLMGPGTEREKQARLRRLANQARRFVEDKAECPECGDDGPHEDNGHKGADRTFLCRVCRTQFDAEAQ